MQEGLQEGRQEGLQEGRRQEARGLVCRLLERRCGRLGEGQRQRLADLPLESLEALSEALLEFSGLADQDRWLASQGPQGWRPSFLWQRLHWIELAPSAADASQGTADIALPPMAPLGSTLQPILGLLLQPRERSPERCAAIRRQALR